MGRGGHKWGSGGGGGGVLKQHVLGCRANGGQRGGGILLPTICKNYHQLQEYYYQGWVKFTLFFKNIPNYYTSLPYQIKQR